ncbi:MAG: acyl-CoA dehydrogenase [Actinomycetia bacterium]|nr:acyl-CoA dehydrogenase [Actinomycetes bacterium]
MDTYVPPLVDISFVLDVIADLPGLLDAPDFTDIDRELVDQVLSEIGRFMAEVVAPINRTGDEQGAVRNADATVTTAEGFKQAYDQYVATGFGAIPFDPTYGGGGFPWTVAIVIQELLTSSSLAFSLCPLLTQGAIDAIQHHGSADQKDTYLPKMLTGEWTGTMNLTEPQAGSDVGALTAKAEPVGDGSYQIAGQKIFITYGEHDLTDNIIHLVLARTPGSPPGTRGISMFLVPKYLVGDDGSLGERNDVTCVSIEHKLGIHASPTCVLSYGENGGAIGWLIGEEGDGMRNMFTMMNNARLSVGLQGLALAERSYQQALSYAEERLQGTAVGAERGTSSPIIDHADVRRMLMTERSWIDAMRCLIYANAAALDRSTILAGTEEGDRAKELAELYIPLSKSLCTDLGSELTSLAVQIHGGMGYVEETGIAQHYRDARIAPIYEGTNGIQAADLVGRKLPMRGGGVIADQLDMIDAIAGELSARDELAGFGRQLEIAVGAARRATEWLIANGVADPNQALGGSSPYLRLLGTVVCGGLMGRLGLAAVEAGDDMANGPDGFHRAKVVSARFFGEQIVPTVVGLEAVVTAGADDLFALSPDQLR